VFKRRQRDLFLHANASNWCHNLLLQMAILTEVRYLHFSLKWKDILPKKVSSEFSYTLTYRTLKYERNRIFHPCRGILILSDFYRQALLKGSKKKMKFIFFIINIFLAGKSFSVKYSNHAIVRHRLSIFWDLT